MTTARELPPTAEMTHDADTPDKVQPVRRSHPSRAMFRKSVIVGGLSVLGCAALAPWAAGSWVMGPLAVLAGLSIGACWWSVVGLRHGEATRAADAVTRALALGHVDDAEAHLQPIARSSLRTVRRIDHLFRAKIAMRRGDVTAAGRQADSVIAVPLGVFRSPEDLRYRAEAIAIRAFVGASSEEPGRIRADIARVRQSTSARLWPLGLVSVAEGLLLEREGNHEALREHFARERFALFEATGPRERALVRALERRLKAPPSTVYRQAGGSPEPASRGGEPGATASAAQVAPAAAASVQESVSPLSGGLTDFEHGRTHGLTIAVWRAPVILSGVYLAWLLVRELFGDVFATPAMSVLEAVAALLVLLVLFALLEWGFFFARLRGEERARSRLYAAETQMGAGDMAAAEARMLSIAREPSDVVAAWGWYHLATIANRRGAFKEVVERCDAAISRLKRLPDRSWVFGQVWASIIGERAFALAALGRVEDATGELAKIPRGSVFRERDELRVRLVCLVRGDAFEAAARLVSSAPMDLPLSLRDELLRDLVRAAATEAVVGAVEVMRLAEEMGAHEEHRMWIDIVAPSLRDRFEMGHATTVEEQAR